MKNEFKQYILSIIIFIILLIGLVTFSYIPAAIFHIDISKLSPTLIIMYNLSCDIGYLIIIMLLYKNTLKKDFQLFIKKFITNFDEGFKYYFIGLIIMIISNLILSIFVPGASANNENAVRALINKYPIYMIFSVSLYAPITEELIFRKSIKDIITIKNNKFTKYLYIITSGLIFAAMHIINMATSIYDYLYLIPYLALGISFSSLYYKTDNIFSSMCMHAFHNTIAIILYIIVGV